MTEQEVIEFHRLATKLADLTEPKQWEASRYAAIGATMEKLAEYCAVCDCKKGK